MNDLTPAQIEIAKAMSEDELQANILDMALKAGWLCYHTRPAMNKRGKWSSPMMGNPGFPDLVLARHPIVIFFELKSEKGKLTVQQQEWYHALPNCLVVKPRNWLSGEVEELLR